MWTRSSLMDIDRVYMSHADDDIGKYLDQLNEVRSHIRPDASAEVMEALERSYGNMYFDAGNFDIALRHQFAALEWAGKLPMNSQRAQLYRLGTIAELYNAMELPRQALAYVRQAFALPIDSMPAGNRLSLLGARAMALIQLGRFNQAGSALKSAGRLPAATARRLMQCAWTRYAPTCFWPRESRKRRWPSAIDLPTWPGRRTTATTSPRRRCCVDMH